MASKHLVRDTRGAVYVEFLLAFIPLFVMFLGMLQMGLLYGASLVVQHSANVAVRAAMVVMDDDPYYYEGAERRSIEGGHGTSSFVENARETFGAAFGAGAPVMPEPGNARLQAIELAAGMPLLPFAPSMRALARNTQSESARAALGLGIDDGPEARVAMGLFYNTMGLAVSLRGDRSDALDAPTATGDGGQVTARVTYLFHCQIPLVNRMMCEDVAFLRFGTDPGALAALALAAARGEISRQQLQETLTALQLRQRRLHRWQSRLDHLGDVRLGALAAVGALGGASPRVVPIDAEASMPMQSGNYCYVSQGEAAGCWDQHAPRTAAVEPTLPSGE